MPLLKNGEVLQDEWVVLEGETENPVALSESSPQSPVIIPFANLPAWLETHASNALIGTLFPADADIELLKPYLDRLELIALVFAGFKDGRAFSQARKIREQLHFTKEIRATGHLLPDQYQFLIRTGFSTVSLPETANLMTWKKAMHDFNIAYQPALGKEKRLGGLHWRI